MCTVFQKVKTALFLPLTLSNLNRCANFFHHLELEEICNNVTKYILPHFRYIVALPCEVTDTFKYAANQEGNMKTK